jgi:hypothetical protein
LARKGKARHKSGSRGKRGKGRNPAAARSRGGEEAQTFTGKSKRSGGGPIPAWVMFPVGLAVGWFVAGWPGAAFGGVIGFFLWRSRA